MKNTMNVVRKWSLAVLVLASSITSADVLWLKNGDKLTGELVNVIDGHIVFNSEVLGELKISQLQIASVETDSAYTLAVGLREPMKNCVFTRKEGQQWLNCGGEEKSFAEWEKVKQVAEGELYDKTRYSMGGSVAVALSHSGGNTEEEEVAVDVRYFIRNDKNRHNFAVDLDKQENDGVQTKDEQRYAYQYDRFVSEKWYLSGRLGLKKDDFKFLEEERTIGFGVGYQVFDDEIMRLSLEAGIDFIEENFADGSDDEREALRGGTDFSWKVLPSGLTFFHRNNLELSTESSSDWEIETESGFLIPVIGRLSSEFKFEYDYDNEPANGDESADRVWTVGVRYDW